MEGIREYRVGELDIKEVTLLSVEEAKALSQDQLNLGSWWWLRSPGFYEYAAYVDFAGEVSDYGHSVVNSDIGVRPALRISNLKSSNLNLGDKISVGGETWTIISKDLALCDCIVGKTCFREKVGVFCPDVKVYEQSDIKKWLENWAMDRGIMPGNDIELYMGRS